MPTAYSISCTSQYQFPMLPVPLRLPGTPLAALFLFTTYSIMSAFTYDLHSDNILRPADLRKSSDQRRAVFVAQAVRKAVGEQRSELSGSEPLLLFQQLVFLLVMEQGKKREQHKDW